MPALGAAMAESVLSNFPRVRRAFVDLGTVLLICYFVEIAIFHLSFCRHPYQKCTQILKGAGARGGDGRERGRRGQEKNIKICVTMLVDIKLYVYCNS